MSDNTFVQGNDLGQYLKLRGEEHLRKAGEYALRAISHAIEQHNRNDAIVFKDVLNVSSIKAIECKARADEAFAISYEIKRNNLI